MEKKRKIKCPYCGYEMPIYYNKETVVRGLLVRCKGRNCKRVFEIVIDEVK